MTYFRTHSLLLLIFVLSACSSTSSHVSNRGPNPGVNDRLPTTSQPSPTISARPQEPIGECKVERGKVGRTYKIRGVSYTPKYEPGYVKVGMASFYGKNHHGKSTANGETFDMNALSAAHTTLPLPSCVLVTNLKNNKSVILRVNDRGPFVKSRIIDISYRAAQVLDFLNAGLAEVRVEVITGSR